MHTQRRFQKFTAILLAVLLAVPASIAAFADDVTETVVAYGETVTVDGNIIVEKEGEARGAEAYSMYGEDDTVLTVNGDVTVVSETDTACGIFAGAEGDASTTVTAGDLTVSGNGDGALTQGLNVSTNGSDVDVTTGDVTVAGEYSEAVAVDVYGESKVKVTTGDVTAEDNGVRVNAGATAFGDEEPAMPEVFVATGSVSAGTNPLIVDNKGATVGVDVAGDVQTESYGVQVIQEAFECIRDIDETEFKPSDPEQRVAEWSGEPDEDGSYSFGYYCYGEDGTQYIVNGSYDGKTKETTYTYYEHCTVYADGASTLVDLEGNLLVEGDDACYAIDAQSRVPEAPLIVLVGGNVSVVGETENWFTAIHAMASNNSDVRVGISGDVEIDKPAGGSANVMATEESSVGLLVGGDYTYSVEDEFHRDAVSEAAWLGSVAAVYIEGDLTAENGNGSMTGIDMYAGRDSEAAALVFGDVSVKSGEGNWWDEETIGAIAVRTDSRDSEKADATVTVSGDVSFDGPEGYGVMALNQGGTIDAHVEGSVSSTNNGIAAVSTGYTVYDEETDSDQMKYADENETVITVDGNVNAVNEDGEVSGISVFAGEGSAVTLDVGGDVVVDGPVGTGILARSQGGEIAVDVDGSVMAPSLGILAETEFVDNDTPNSIAISTGGDLTVTGVGSQAIDVNMNGGDASIGVGGDVTAFDGSGITVFQEGFDYGDYGARTAMEGDVNVSVAGDVTVGDTAIDAWADGAYGSVTINVGGDISEVTDATETYGIIATAEEEGTLNIGVAGDVNILAIQNEENSGLEWEDATGIQAQAFSGSESTVAIQGNLGVEGAADTTGIYASAMTGASQQVEIGGNLEVVAEGKASAVEVRTKNAAGIEYDEGSELPAVSVNIGGNIETQHDGDSAIFAENMAGTIKVSVGGDVDGSVRADQRPTENGTEYGYTEGSTSIEIGGNLHASGNESAHAIVANSLGEDFTTDIHVGGDVTAVSNGNAAAIDLYAQDGETAVNVDGDVRADGDWYIYGAYGNASEGGVTSILVNGDVRVNQAPTAPEEEEEYDFDPEQGEATGVTARSSSGGAIRVTVVNEVNATAEGNAIGINVQSYGEGSRSDVMVGGTVTAIGGSETAGVQTSAHNGGTADVYLMGDVISTGNALNLEDSSHGEWTVTDEKLEFIEDEYVYTREEYVDGELTEVRYYKHVAENGDVFYYTDNGYEWQVDRSDAEGSVTNVEVAGNVYAGDAALNVDMTNENSLMDVVVNGTMVGEHAVLLSDETIMDNVTLTVWEIKPNEDGSVAERYREVENEEGETERKILGEDEEFEKRIQYIIKLEQPDVGALDTEGTTDYMGYDVANEGDTITLKIDVPFRYELTNAFNGTDTKIALTKNEDGEYFLVVPRGGAVLLSVEMEYIKPEAEKNRDIVNNVEKAAGEGYEVEVANDPANEKTVVIKAEEGAEKVELAFDLQTIRSLDYNEAKAISIQSNDGSSKAELKVAEARQALRNAPGSELIVETDKTVEVVKAVREKIEEEYEIAEGVTEVIKIVLRDASGLETELPGAHITLKLQAENTPGMKWLFVNENGEISDAEAEWVEGTDSEAGYWKVKYVGYGSYIPVLPKTAK